MAATPAPFRTVTAQQGVPLAVTDAAATAGGDPTGQGLSFLLVALGIGSYGSVAVIGAARAALGMRVRALVGPAASLVVSVNRHRHRRAGVPRRRPRPSAVRAMGRLYAAGIVAIGVGLHTFLRRRTTLAPMVLFVMLNLTTSGGGAGLGGRLLAGLAMLAAAGGYERGRRLAAPTRTPAEEEMEERGARRSGRPARSVSRSSARAASGCPADRATTSGSAHSGSSSRPGADRTVRTTGRRPARRRVRR